MNTPEKTERLTSTRQGPMVVLVTLLTTALVVGLLLMEVWYRVGVVNMGYEMTQLTRERQRLLEERKRIKIEATVNARTERLDQIARDSLHLEPVRGQQVIAVRRSPVAVREQTQDEAAEGGRVGGR